MPLDDIRTWIAGQVRARVVGGGSMAADRRRALFDGDGERWFEDDSPIRRVHGDSSMFIGGIRAILLQSLHPLAMAGVADHSDYRTDPWGRLQRTSDFIAATTFGPASEAEAVVAKVRAVHKHVKGVAPDGRLYAATDPHLLRWVHIVEVDSFLSANQVYGGDRLDAPDSDMYVRQMARIARSLGVLEPPESTRELHAQLLAFRPELQSTEAAREAAHFLIRRPPVNWAARPAYSVIAAASVELLPRWTREPLRLPSYPVLETVLVRPAAHAVTGTLRWALSAPPASTPG